MLKVNIKSASNLPDVDKFSGKSDPYVVVSFQGETWVRLNSNSVLSVSSFVYVAERWASFITAFSIILNIYCTILYLD